MGLAETPKLPTQSTIQSRGPSSLLLAEYLKSNLRETDAEAELEYGTTAVDVAEGETISFENAERGETGSNHGFEVVKPPAIMGTSSANSHHQRKESDL